MLEYEVADHGSQLRNFDATKALDETRGSVQLSRFDARLHSMQMQQQDQLFQARVSGPISQAVDGHVEAGCARQDCRPGVCNR